MIPIYAAKHLADVILMAMLRRQRDQQKPETDFSIFVQQQHSRAPLCRYPSHYRKVAIVLGGERICSKVRTSMSIFGRKKPFNRRKT